MIGNNVLDACVYYAKCTVESYVLDRRLLSYPCLVKYTLWWFLVSLYLITSAYYYEVIIIIIIIILLTMFMVRSSWHSHCESSHGSFDEGRLSAGWPPTLGPNKPIWQRRLTVNATQQRHCGISLRFWRRTLNILNYLLAYLDLIGSG